MSLQQPDLQPPPGEAPGPFAPRDDGQGVQGDRSPGDGSRDGARGGVLGTGGLGEVARLAYPLVLTQMSITAMGVADSMIVGRLGAAPLAAVGLSGTWLWTLASFFLGTSMAVQTFVAQRHGAGRTRECGGWCWQGLASNVPPAALLALILVVGGGGIVSLLEPTDTIAPHATGYLRARALGIPALTAAFTISSFFRGIGDTRTPLYATLLANGVNLLLDFGLVFGLWGLPRLEVVGAGLATSIAEWIYVAVLLAAFLRPALAERYDTRWRPPAAAEIRRLWRTGLPIGGQWILEMLSYSVFVTLVARMGDAQMAASHAFVQLLSLSFMQASGISTATATLVGQAIGAGRLERVARSFRSSMVLGGLLGTTIAALFVLVPDTLVGLFTKDPEVLAFARPLLLIGAAYQLIDAVGIVTDGALRGAGDTRWPFAVRCSLSWLVFLPAAWIFAFPLGGGLTGAWAGGLVHIVLLAAALLWRFRSRAWQRITI
jgi:MATE family multidrug resistance protein